MQKLNSKERMLRTISHQDADHVPCCFMSFTALRNRHGNNMLALCQAELEMGLDSMLFVPSAPRPQRPEHPDLRGLPIHFHPDVTSTQHCQTDADGSDVLHRKYKTPAGELNVKVRISEDWHHGQHIPFIDDFQIPRAEKNLITQESDLEALQYLLVKPMEEDKACFHKEVTKARAFTDEKGVVLAGGWGVGMDMANWLYGMQNLMIAIMERPEFVSRLLHMIHAWNKERMKTVLAAPVDLFFRRSWYEGSEFIVPEFYRKVVLPIIKAEADLVHEHGTKFCYICTSGTAAMLDFYKASGIDVLVGIDPVQGAQTDMAGIKQAIGRKICLWGGVSGAITVELGTEDEVRAAVRKAIEVLGPRGHILSPIDNITVDALQTWKNVDIFIDEWKRCR
ncbi:MAG: hypothetical protein L6437_16030 [Kiritimatiellae bacterium]|nr:hypothetical protein [Kiritimatiellia bacterium]